MRIEDIAGQLWPGEPVAVEPLAGGITNQNFTVIAHGDRFVVRLGGRDTELLGIDRRAEDAALRLAQSVGVGPDVVAVVPGEGVLVTRFIAGRPISAEEMRTERTIAWVAEAVRAIHSGDAIPGTFSPFRRVESYAATAED
ncbi:MAG TPA: phosphotransferase, partial [Actinomycetota bacterium]|nr:phosphotransferase [Actinomycetota bacterium]